MRPLISTMIILLFVALGFAQTDLPEGSDELRTLTGKGTRFGAYLGLNMATSDNLNESIFIRSGITLAAVFNHRMSMGVGAYGYSSDISHLNLDSSTYLSGGYGGLLVEPVLFPRSPVHFTVPILMGGGSTALNEEVLSGNYRTYSRNYENFLFFEPGLNIELSITKIIRLGLGTKYMITTPLTTAAHKELLSGLNYAFNLKLGWF